MVQNKRDGERPEVSKTLGRKEARVKMLRILLDALALEENKELDDAPKFLGGISHTEEQILEILIKRFTLGDIERVLDLMVKTVNFDRAELYDDALPCDVCWEQRKEYHVAALITKTSHLVRRGEGSLGMNAGLYKCPACGSVRVA